MDCPDIVSELDESDCQVHQKYFNRIFLMVLKYHQK